MATQAYRDWVADGRPWRMCRPIFDYRLQLMAARWSGGHAGGIGDEPHLQSDEPKDHCPFSVSGWPKSHPYPYVTALDINHRPEDGYSLDTHVAYWVAEAEAGRTPWVKYIIFKGRRWDVRKQWVPVSNSGHYDHAHISFRTDHIPTTIGTWSVLRKDTPVTTTPTPANIWLLNITSPSRGYNAPAQDWLKYGFDAAKGVGDLKTQVAGLVALVDALGKRLPPAVDPAALGAALAASPAFIDAVATAVAAKLGMVPTAGEIARAVGALTWHGSVG